MKETKNFIFFNFDNFFLNLDKKLENILKDSLLIIAYCHDFGKCTTHFQNKIFNKNYDKKLSTHGLISAFFGKFVFQEYIKNIKKRNYSEDLVSIFSFFIFKSIREHHVDIKLREPTLELSSSNMHLSFEDIMKQLQNIRENNNNQTNRIYNKLFGTDINYLEKFEDFLITYKEKYQFIDDSIIIDDPFRNGKKSLFYFLFNLIHSLLLESDKRSAGEIDLSKFSEIKDFNIQWIENYKKSENFDNRELINQFREDIFKSSLIKLDNILKNSFERKLFTLNAPTGSGKTLTMLGLAIMIYNYFLESRNQKRKIIYALPFISIIDQNYKVCHDLLKANLDKHVSSDLLLAFHHLADRIYKSKDKDEEISFEESDFLIENWYSQIIITTFYQIFKSIFTNKKKQLQRFNKLINSIIIIDEIQAIPLYLHEIVGRTLKTLVNKFNSTVIIGTATHPKIFGKTIDIIELYNEDYLNRKYKLDEKNGLLHRYNINLERLLDKKINKDELVKNISDDVSKKQYNNFGVILNTIESSKIIFKSLEKKLNGYKSIYLSSNIPPVVRLERINNINHYLEKGVKFFIVSTQIIEAGVDISLKIIYRDFAPIDSLIQTSGRVNRNKEDIISSVYIFELLNDKGRPYSGQIYDDTLLAKTKYFLDQYYQEKKTKKIPEYEFYNLCEKYYKNLSKTANKNYTRDESGNDINILELIKQHSHYKLEKYFRLIEKHGTEISFFIDDERIYNNEEDLTIKTPKELWDKYKEIYKTKKRELERYLYQKKEFGKIKRRFYEQCVNLRIFNPQLIKILEREVFEKVGEIYYINHKSKYYNHDTGIDLKNKF